MKLDPKIKCPTCRIVAAKVTVAELAEMFVLTPERIRQLVNSGVIEQERDGIPLQAAIAGYRDFLRGDFR